MIDRKKTYLQKNRSLFTRAYLPEFIFFFMILNDKRKIKELVWERTWKKNLWHRIMLSIDFKLQLQVPVAINAGEHGAKAGAKMERRKSG